MSLLSTIATNLFAAVQPLQAQKAHTTAHMNMHTGSAH
jgi:hypothetical protein